MTKRVGKYTLMLESEPSIKATAAVASKKEGMGPLAKYIDTINDDALFGQKSWEKAESEMQKQAISAALNKAKLSASEIDYAFAGDLLNQCIGSHYAMRDLNMPFVGLYGACSTMAESLAMASIFVDTGAARRAVAATSSHFCAAERQFRYPLEYGAIRTPTSQWTVTGSGAAVVVKHENPPYVKAVTFGRIVDKGINDINNMGAAMAPAACETIKSYLQDTQTTPNDYDLILTGDLASVGSELLHDLLKREGIDITKNHNDCGLMIFDLESQKVDAGASGCGCAATVLCSYIIPQMQQGKINDVLFCATGALMSTISIQQGETIPGVAHLVHISNH